MSTAARNINPVMVREATHDDIIHFVKMAREFSQLAGEPFDRDDTADHVEWMIDQENTVAFIAVDIDGNPVGICGGIVYPTFWDNSKLTATETWWFVRDEARGSGAGMALMDALESWAKAAGAWRLSMMTIVGIAPGIEEMYEKRGYREREKTFLKEL